MQRISSTTPQIRRTRQGFLAIGALASLAAVSFMTAIPVAAVTGPIVVTVTSDFNRNDHLEGVFNGALANTVMTPISFVDANACPGGGACNLNTDYHVNIRWGDTLTSNIVADPSPVKVAPDGGRYTVSGVHTYNDENNCPGQTCGFDVKVTVTYQPDGTVSTQSAPATIAVKDQPLLQNATGSFNATTNVPFSGVIGSFHDANKWAADQFAGDPNPEFIVTVDWGDGSATAGTTTVTNPDPTMPCNPGNGLGTGQGCQVQVNGTHTYTQAGQYQVNLTVADGSNQGQSFIGWAGSTATVAAARDGAKPAPTNPPGTRGAHPAPPVGAGPRTAHFVSTSHFRGAAAQSATTSAPAQSVDLAWLDALRSELLGPAGFQRLFR